MTIDATTTGATPNDGQDDTLAVLAAVERCRAERPRHRVSKRPLRFSRKRKSQSPRMSMPIGDMHGITIDGQGSEFIFHGITACFGSAAARRLP